MAKTTWMWVALVVVTVLIIPIIIFWPKTSLDGEQKDPRAFVKQRKHLDHSAFFSQPFGSPQDVTRSCLKCHKEAASEVMNTSHWTWVADDVLVNRGNKKVKIGKKNLINNFCLGIQSNWPACTKCHAGYGWKDDKFDFSQAHNVDCLICHDGSGAYSKDLAGIPAASVDLLKVAKGVSYPKRENCGICHFYGGGGLAVKHGDLDTSLINAKEEVDVHMGKHGLSCIDCHRTTNHLILGKSRSNCSGCSSEQSVSCTDCHKAKPHNDQRLNNHTETVACQTCHLPKYAKLIPTKTDWDWSKAGDDKRQDDPHKYLKIKGEFKYQRDVTPEYYWFNGTMDRYLAGDKINPNIESDINKINGQLQDPNSKIFPFKIHHALQPYDKKYNHLLIPKTAGEGGYWTEFNWQKAFTLGSKASGIPYSGEYGFAKTKMYWPLSHMVSPKEDAIKCIDCHSPGGRLNWKELGYEGDPMNVGGRKRSMK